MELAVVGHLFQELTPQIGVIDLVGALLQKHIPLLQDTARRLNVRWRCPAQNVVADKISLDRQLQAVGPVGVDPG